MKRAAILFMVITLIIACGCEKPDEVLYEVNAPKQLQEVSGSELATKKLYLEDILGATEFDAFRLVAVDDSSVTLCVWQKEKLKFVDYDYYSKTMLSESRDYSYDYFIKFYEIAKKSYAVCADRKAEGLEIKIIDVYLGKELANVSSYNFPHVAFADEKIYLSVSEKKEEKRQDRIYCFDQDGLVDTEESYEYQILHGGKVRGTAITAMESTGKVLYRQISTAKNGLLFQGEMKIIKTDFNENKTEEIESVNALLSISGNDEMIFGTIYGAENPVDNSGFCYDIANKTTYSLNNINSYGDTLYLGKLGAEYLVRVSDQLLIMNMHELTYECWAKENMSDFLSCESGEKFAYTSGKGDEKEIIIAQRNRATFSNRIDVEIRQNLAYEQNLPHIEVMHDTGNLLYYFESSTYGYEDDQRATAVVWEYNKVTKTARRLRKFSYIFIDFEGVAFDDGILSIPHDMGKVTRINTLG